MGKRKLGGVWIKPALDQNIAVGALAANALVSEGGGTATVGDMRCTSIDVTIGMHDHTAFQGPLVIGVAHSDYTDAEIEEVVEATAGWSAADKIAEERSKRLIRVLGVFPGTEPSEVLWLGQSRKFRLNWRLASGQGINFWAFNTDSSVFTTGTIVDINGHANCKLGY